MAEHADYSGDAFARTRRIAAGRTEIFALLSDPARHHDTEPGDWVRDAIDPKPITGVGDVFGMNMHAEPMGGDYRMHSTVTTFEQDEAIAWDPGQLDDTGTAVPGGWRWRYDLAEADGGTDVTLTYDWSATPQATREHFGGFPPFGPHFLDASLESLDHAVIGS